MTRQKQTVVLLFAIAAFFIVLLSRNDLNSIQVQPPAGFANNPPGPLGTGLLNCTFCHTGIPRNDSTNFILQMGLDTQSLSTIISGVTTYMPGTQYYLRVTGQKPSVVYGFELTAEDNSDNGSDVGNFTILDTTTTTVVTTGGCTYVGHHNASNNNEWTFNWTSPASANYHGPVTFYYACNDGSGPSLNQPGCCDTVYVVTKTIRAAGTNGVSDIDGKVSGLNVYPNLFAQNFRIAFYLKENSQVEADIIDMTGQVVKTVLNEQLGEGDFNRVINVENLAAGIYVLKLRVGAADMALKIVKE